MLLDTIRSMLGAGPAAGAARRQAPEVDPIHLAACALLLEIAYADGEFSPPERAHLERVLARQFALSPEDGRRLIALAEEERTRAVDDFHFTRVLDRSYDLGQKMVLAEIMWGMVLADGKVADHEQYLARKIANLLDLEPGYLAAARAAAREAAEQRGDERRGDGYTSG